MKFEDYVYYDETSPSYLRWKVDRWGGRIKVKSKGDVAGGIHKIRKYWYVKIGGVNFLNHRIIFLLHNPEYCGKELLVDHLDGDRSNNNISNLRLASPSINSRNMKMRSDNSSGITGVGLRIDAGGRAYWVGRYSSNGKQVARLFSINKFGFDVARELAIKFRTESVMNLNIRGAGYTDRHGK